MASNNPPQIKSPDQVREIVGKFKDYHDPEIILEEVGRNLDAYGKDYGIHDELNELNDQAMSLHEFGNGKLMTKALPEEYSTFAIDFSRKLQKQYVCQTIAEKAIAESAVMNYVEQLGIQKRLTAALDNQEWLSTKGKSHEECERGKDSFYASVDRFHGCKRAELGLKLINTLYKELDRASRQFLMSIHTLRMMKQPPVQVNIKTSTAIVGQNQLFQTDNRSTNGHGQFNSPI